MDILLGFRFPNEFELKLATESNWGGINWIVRRMLESKSGVL